MTYALGEELCKRMEAALEKDPKPRRGPGSMPINRDKTLRPDGGKSAWQ